MFSWLYNLLGAFLSWLNSWTGSYALALLFYALAFKILFLPFSIKQQKNQIAMAKLTPKIELIRAKYRGRTDQVTMRKQQEEIMALQQKEGYSPFSGCLPMLLQLPIIIFLYNVIRNPLSYIAKVSEELVVKANEIATGAVAEFSKIDQLTLSGVLNSTDPAGIRASQYLAESGVDVSLIPNFDLWGLNLAPAPSFLSLAVLIPFIAAALQWFSMFITRKLSGNANQVAMQDNAQTNMSMRIMDLMFPLLTVWLTFSFSGMLGLYWIYQSVITIIQTVILAKAMPVPKYTEEEIKAMRRAQKAQEKAQKAIIKTQPKYKSLHYIDDDDYEELPTVKSDKKEQSSKNISQDKPEIKD